MKKENHLIDITISDLNKVTSDYNANTLSDNLGNYIYKECQGIPIRNNINLKITTNFELSEEKKKEISDLIHSYYGLEVQDNLIFNRYNLIRNLILMIVGFIILILAFNIQNKSYNVIPEVMIIIGWILLWEVLYYFLFNNAKSNLKIKRYKKLAKCKIKFEIKKSN